MATKKEMKEQILKKAMKDATFKHKLLSNPKEALKELYKTNKGFDPSIFEKAIVKIYIEKNNELMIVIPEALTEDKQLSEEELSKIAAGSCGSCGYH